MEQRITLEDLKLDTHLHFKIVAYNKSSEDKLLDAVELQITDCVNEEQVIMKAKRILSRSFYKVEIVSECDQCVANRELIEIQKRFIRKMIG